MSLALGILLGASPFLRGAWEVWSQSAIFAAFALGLGARLSWRLLREGSLPIPGERWAIPWAAALLSILLFSSARSPLPASAWPGARVQALGLLVFLSAASLSLKERRRTEAVLRVSGWALALAVLYGRFGLHESCASFPFPNPNALAGCLIFFAGVARESGDGALLAALAAGVAAAHSLGAWLALWGAVFLGIKSEKLKVKSTGERSASHFSLFTFHSYIALFCILLAAPWLWGKLSSPAFADRLSWWGQALSMAADRPLLGFGPGSFPYVSSALRAARGLGSLYAHEFYAETAAQNGIPFLLLLVGGMIVCLYRGMGDRGWGIEQRDTPSPNPYPLSPVLGALALAIDSLWDYPLSIPAIGWLFFYALGAGLREGREFAVQARAARAGLAAAIFGLSFWAAWGAMERWEADSLSVQGAALLKAGQPGRALELLRRASALAADPETERLAAVALSREGLFKEAARRMERSCALDPYRASSRKMLSEFSRAAQEKVKSRR